MPSPTERRTVPKSESFQLPADGDGDKAEAHYERGILTVRLPKVDYLKPKSIKVQTAQ